MYRRTGVDDSKTEGFTLAELLIVVAILAVLVSIAIPVFTSQLERARRTVDMSNMRNAYAVLITGITTGENKPGVQYYYDAASGSLVSTKPKGYGKANTNANEWWTGAGSAYGTPNNKAMLIEMDSISGNVTYRWGDYAGLKVTSATEYNSLTLEAKVDRDVALLNGLQGEFRSMTYAQLRNLFLNSDGTLKAEFNQSSYSGDTNTKQLLVQTDSKGYMCVTLAESTIKGGNVSTNGTNAHNKIYTESIFQSIGYDISSTTSENYIINSVNSSLGGNQGTNARIWLNTGIKQSELSKLSSSKANQLATKAYTYIKGAGIATDDRVSQRTRVNQ